MRKTYEIFADYHQICLKAAADLDAPEHFTDEACRQRVLPGSGVVTIMPVRNMTVPLTVEIAAAAPPLDLAAFDHVAEASLDLGTGTLVVADLMGDFCETLPVAPGPYRLRFSGAALGSLSFDGLEGDDTYLVTLWPAPMAPVNVLKQWEG